MNSVTRALSCICFARCVSESQIRLACHSEGIEVPTRSVVFETQWHKPMWTAQKHADTSVPSNRRL